MKNKKILILIIILVAIILVGIIIGVNFSKKDENQILAETEENLQSEETTNNVETNNNEIINNTETTNNSETTNNNGTTNNIEATNNNEENSSLGSENMNNQNIKINLIVNNKTFSATLNNNETVKELTAMFPMTLNMSDLNSNEKYNYLDSRLTTNSSSPRRINAGDIKLYGNSCLVVFYESFNTSYSYTDLGKVDNAKDFVNELGRGNVTITFELAN